MSAHPNTSTDAARRRFGGLRQPGVKDGYRPKAPVPPAGEKEMRKHLGGLGRKPQRVQGSALPPAAQALDRAGYLLDERGQLRRADAAVRYRFVDLFALIVKFLDFSFPVVPLFQERALV